MALKSKKKQGYYQKGSVVVDGSGICDKMSFTAAEAYKMLRTKINLVIPQNVHQEEGSALPHTCKIIGVTSALRGEGKTTTSINLAYTIAEKGQRVLLIEGDMRLPNLARRLNLREEDGLSNVLTAQIRTKEALKKHVTGNGISFYVITAGDIPPRPSELLESNGMEVLLQTMTKVFDYIVVDLPPVTVVTDALSISTMLDGMLLVVRQNHCDKHSLRDALYQFNLAETNILGVVFNCSTGSGSRSVYYRYGKKYYKSTSGKE